MMKKLMSAVSVIGILTAGAAQADIFGPFGGGWSIFGPASGNGAWGLTQDGQAAPQGFSIFGSASGSGAWGMPMGGAGAPNGWSIFGPANGSGAWTIFGPIGRNGNWGMPMGGPGAPNGWSIFGPASGNGAWGMPVGGAAPNGWVLFGPTNVPNSWSIFGPASGPGAWGMHPQPQPAMVGIHCTFGEEVMMLAKSVPDCEGAGGVVHEDVKAAHDAHHAQSDGDK